MAMWNESRDKLLFRMLDHYSCYNNKRIGIDDVELFDEILQWPGELKMFGIKPKDVQERYPILYARYTTWKCIIKFDGVCYNPENNSVEAGHEVWNAICNDNNFAAVYQRNGNEPMWHELQGIFGPDSIKAERKAKITPVKTSRTPPSVDYTIQYSSSEEDEEYISPEVAPDSVPRTQERTLVWTISPQPPRIPHMKQDYQVHSMGTGPSRLKNRSELKSKHKLDM